MKLTTSNELNKLKLNPITKEDIERFQSGDMNGFLFIIGMNTGKSMLQELLNKQNESKN